MDAALIFIAITVAYLSVGFWSLWYSFKRPILMPFWIFRLICGIGKKAPLGDLPEGMDGLDNVRFKDSQYRQWFG